MSPNGIGIAAIIMWSLLPLLITLARDIPPLQLVSLSWFVGFVILGTYYIYKGENLWQHFKRPINDYFFMGFGIGVYTVLIFYGFHAIPPFEANVLNYLWPLFLTVFLAVFQNIRLTPMKILGVVSGFSGCVLLFWMRQSDLTFQGLEAGHAAVFSAAIIWALYSCFARDKNYPTAFMVPVFLIASILCMIGSTLWEKPVRPDMQGWLLVFLLGAFRIAYVFWDVAIRKGDRLLLSSFSYTIPLLATLFLMAFGFAAGNVLIAVGGGMIIAGCLTVNAEQIGQALKKFQRK